MPFELTQQVAIFTSRRNNMLSIIDFPPVSAATGRWGGGVALEWSSNRGISVPENGCLFLSYFL